MKKIAVLTFIIILAANILFASLVPGKKFCGKITKLNKKEHYIVIREKKFYFRKKFQKEIEKYKDENKIIEFYYLKKNGKNIIIHIKKHKRELY